MSQPKGNKQPPSGGKNARVHFPLDNEEMDVTVDESSNSINDQQGKYKNEDSLFALTINKRGLITFIKCIHTDTHTQIKHLKKSFSLDILFPVVEMIVVIKQQKQRVKIVIHSCIMYLSSSKKSISQPPIAAVNALLI